jgi:glycosyltransferase involved in cell wall biosynthesis
MTSPLISVVLPTRNRAELLRRSVRSVLAQTFTDLELIVVDDGSSDHTPAVLASFHDDRLRVIRRDELRSSAAAARNAAIRASRGALLAFQDDDDFWLVNKLARQLEVLRAAPEEAGLCLSGFIRKNFDGPQYVGGRHLMTVLDYRRGYCFGHRDTDYSLISTPSWLVKREALARAGMYFDEQFRSLDDWELGLRLTKVCAFVHADEPLFVQDRTQGTGMVYNEPALAGDTRLFVEKHGERWAGERRAQARHFYVIGKVTTQMPVAERRRWLWRAVRANPIHFKAWIAIGLSYLGEGVMARVTSRVRSWREAVKRRP